MAAFQFRLQGLLKLREHHEGAARQDLADAQRRSAEAKQELHGLTQQRSTAAEQVAERGTGSVTAIQSAYANIHRLGDLEQESRRRLVVLDAEHEERRQVAVDAQRARRVVEQLQERHLHRYLKELQRVEDQFTDETGTQLAARRMVVPDPHREEGMGK